MTTLFIPTRQQIESISDFALNCFGEMAEVQGEVYRAKDVNGKLFAHYYTKTQTGGSISMSQKEDELVRHVGTSAKFTSWELDKIEAEMLNKGERVREL